jgi:hypothetical protein
MFRLKRIQKSSTKLVGPTQTTHLSLISVAFGANKTIDLTFAYTVINYEPAQTGTTTLQIETQVLQG